MTAPYRLKVAKQSERRNPWCEPETFWLATVTDTTTGRELQCYEHDDWLWTLMVGLRDLAAVCKAGAR